MAGSFRPTTCMSPGQTIFIGIRSSNRDARGAALLRSEKNCHPGRACERLRGCESRDPSRRRYQRDIESRAFAAMGPGSRARVYAHALARDDRLNVVEVKMELRSTRCCAYTHGSPR